MPLEAANRNQYCGKSADPRSDALSGVEREQAQAEWEE
jgi:hypothetical protein